MPHRAPDGAPPQRLSPRTYTPRAPRRAGRRLPAGRPAVTDRADEAARQPRPSGRGTPRTSSRRAMLKGASGMGFTIGLGFMTAGTAGGAAAGSGGSGTEGGSGSGAGGGAGGGGTPAPLAAIAPEGWRATHADIAAFAAGGTFTVRRPGFDAAAAPVTVTEDVATTARVRLPWPDQNVLTADEVALSDVIRVGDAVEGMASNGSAVPMPRPVAMWLHPDRARADGGAFTARLAVAHRYARSGRPVAAVRFVATDGTTSVEALVSQMDAATYPASGLTVPHFAAALDLSGFAPGTALALDAVIYPWVGEAYDTRLHGAPQPSISFGGTRVAVPPVARFAYVDAAAGDDAAGAASGDPAAAAAAPFATLKAAALAAGGAGTVRLRPGSHALENFSAVPAADVPLLVEAADPAQGAVLQAPQGNLSGGLPDRLHLRNLTIRKGSATNYYVLDSGASLGSEHMLVAENCTFDAAGHASMGTAFLGRTGRTWMIGCTAGADGLSAVFSTNCLMVNLIGCGANMGGTAVYNMVGCRGADYEMGDSLLDGAAREAPIGQMLAFSQLGRNRASAGVVRFGRARGAEGLAVVGCVLEGRDGSQPVLSINADGNLEPARNVIVQQCTVVGQRVNFLYQDVGSTRIDKEGSMRCCVTLTRNTKTDVFGRDGALVGNWGTAYRAGWTSNAVLEGDDGGGSVPGPGVWVGETAEAGTVIGSRLAPIEPAWALDASATGTGAGGGDYRPGAGHGLPLLPAGQAPYPVDLFGVAVPDAGRAVAGARQP